MPKRAPRRSLRQQRVPGGSHWTCTACGAKLLPGTLIAKYGGKRYCWQCTAEGVRSKKAKRKS